MGPPRGEWIDCCIKKSIVGAARRRRKVVSLLVLETCSARRTSDANAERTAIVREWQALFVRVMSIEVTPRHENEGDPSRREVPEKAPRWSQATSLRAAHGGPP